MPVTRAFEQESGLADWSFAVPMVGIIVIFDKKHDGPPATLSLNRLINRVTPPKPKTNRSLDWVRIQQLPYVLAALGYDDAPTSEQQLRRRYEIAADIPIVPGPALARARQQSIQGQGAPTSSMFSSVFEHQNLAFDVEYAKSVLGALYQLIERQSAHLAAMV